MLWMLANGFAFGFDQTFTFDLSDFTLDNQDGIVSIFPKSKAYNFEYNIPGYPEIPFYQHIIKTNRPCETSSVRCEILRTNTVATNVSIKLHLPYVQTGVVAPSQETISEATYLSYPDSILKLYNGPALYDDRIVFAIAPFIYDKTDRTLSFISQVRVTYNELPARETLNEEADNRTVYNQYDYLIITQDSLAETFMELRNWKTAKGVKTEIVTLDSIASHYNTFPQLINAYTIKRFIRECSICNNIKMVLLGGTYPIIPAQSCRIEYKGDVQTVLSDMYYACFYDDWTWDANNNGIIGEISGDGVNLTPSISVSRLPIETNAQLSSYIHKLLDYERNPRRDGFLSRLLLSGCMAHWYDNGQSDAHFESEAIYEDNIEPFYPHMTKHYFYDTGNDLGRTGADTIMNATNLSDIINNFRPHWFNMDCHGFVTEWTKNIFTPIFTVNDAAALENDSTPMVIATAACLTSDFSHNYPCLAESFLRHPTGGAIAYWGGSHNGFGTSSPGHGVGPSMQLCGSFWQNLSSSYHFGDAVMKAKKDYLPFAYDTVYAYNWIIKSMNALGDCELPIYTNEPMEFSGTTINIDYTSIAVENLDSEEDFRIAIASKDNGSTAFMVDETIGSGINFPNGYEACSICLTKQNYVPSYIETGRFCCSNGNVSLYLQNQNFKGNMHYYGGAGEIRDVYIGSHVDNEEENGEVSIASDASVDIYFTNRVIIQSGFQCKNGGRLIINPL